MCSFAHQKLSPSKLRDFRVARCEAARPAFRACICLITNNDLESWFGSRQTQYLKWPPNVLRRLLPDVLKLVKLWVPLFYRSTARPQACSSYRPRSSTSHRPRLLLLWIETCQVGPKRRGSVRLWVATLVNPRRSSVHRRHAVTSDMYQIRHLPTINAGRRPIRPSSSPAKAFQEYLWRCAKHQAWTSICLLNLVSIKTTSISLQYSYTMSSPIEAPSNPFWDPELPLSGPVRHSSSLGVSSQTTSNEQSATQSDAENNFQENRKPGKSHEKKKRVGFTGGPETGTGEGSAIESKRVSIAVGLPADRTSTTPSSASPPRSGVTTPDLSRNGSVDMLLPSLSTGSAMEGRSHLPQLSPQQLQAIHQAMHPTEPVRKPRPAIRRAPSVVNVSEGEGDDEPDDDGQKAVRRARAREAFERGKRLAEDERARSAPGSRYTSPERSPRQKPRATRLSSLSPGKIDMRNLASNLSSTDVEPSLSQIENLERRPSQEEAFKLVRKHTMHAPEAPSEPPSPHDLSGMATPVEDQRFFEDYKPAPDQYRGGVLGSLLKLYGQPSGGKQPGHGRASSNAFSEPSTPSHSPPESGATTPNGRWFGQKQKHHSTSSLAHLIGSSTTLGTPSVTTLGEQVSAKLREHQELHKRPHATRKASHYFFSRLSRHRLAEEQIAVDIAETMRRQKYLMRLCRALMLYGAPTHRLEEYMNMSARTLKIQAQFLYIPGSMIMSFDDPSTHTTEVKLVRVNQGLDLGKLRDVHEVYKEVVHNKMSADDATTRLKDVTEKKDKFNRWWRILVMGLAAVCVGPFAFGARLIDLPISFLLGCILGLLQLVVSPTSDLYQNVFEISATVITSFLARAFGSINGGNTFCFAALAQSSIALILPGYTVLCASLELQSRSIVAGSVRMVYAIIYSLFLGYGITIGTAMYGIMDKNATSATTCTNQIPAPYFFPFVPGFAMCLVFINQAKWKQAPMMIFIACAGYIVNYYSAKRFQGNTQVSNTLGALVIGVIANLYSRVGNRVENWFLDLWEDRLRPHYRALRRRILRIKTSRQQKQSAKELEAGSAHAHDNESIYVRQTRRVGYGLAAAAMLPAIFVQVPSGLAVNGSLVAGIASADQISGNATNGTSVANITTFSSEGLNSVAFTVGYSVIQVAIGITVGLFLSAIVVYPLGKKRSGLFSF
nr:uncharacterized upf0442 protein [Quercus suber]